MPDGLHEHDILAWAEQQADLLRRLARGERVNAEIDWPKLIEEVADLGLSELNACKNLIRQAMVHLIKIHAGPRGPRAHWAAEVVGFLGDARDRFAPSMRHRIEIDAIYRLARRQAEVALGHRADGLPPESPWSLDELLAPEADPFSLAGKLA
jgi:hypothetical protein